MHIGFFCCKCNSMVTMKYLCIDWNVSLYQVLFFSFSPFFPLILIDGSFLWSKKWHVVMFFCRVSCGSIYIYIYVWPFFWAGVLAVCYLFFE